MENVQPQEEIVQTDQTVTEQPVEQEIEVTDAEQETPPTPKQEAKPFNPRTDRVEFTTPEQQAKFDDVYKQMKMSDARNQMQLELLQKQQAQLDELKNRNLKTDSAEAERLLVSKIKAARDSGDDFAEITATREMVEYLADKKISERVNVQQQPQPLTYESPDVKYVSDVINEVDSNGQFIRPWMHNDHPEQAVALNALETIKGRYAGDPYALPKTLADLDNFMRSRMTQQKPPVTSQTRAPNPMQGGNLTNNSQRPTIKMTKAEFDIAKKLGVDPKKYAARRDAINKGKK